MSWRRPLWECFYPRIRKETSLQAAAEIVLRQLRDRVEMIGEAQPADSLLQCWDGGRAIELVRRGYSTPVGVTAFTMHRAP